jgi:Fe-S cluster assembly scaffold protein SufB
MPAYKYGFRDRIKPRFHTGRGLSEAVVRTISAKKQEPPWLLAFRLQGLELFWQKPLPQWGADLNQIDFDNLTYYADPAEKTSRTWAEVPQDIKKTFDKIGVPQAERKWLAGVESQYDSEMIYGSLKKDLVKKGVVFCSMDEAVKLYPDLVKKYMNTVIAIGDNKFSALNTAVWSGGSFVYVPKGVRLTQPLQAYFRINSARFGQFERTLIIAETGSSVHYSEGCSAPQYSESSLHAAVVEIIVKPRARVQYTTVQNWYKNVYNLVTKRARVEARGEMIWTDANLGCLAGETKIFTKNSGLKRLDEIKPGDWVYGLDFDSLRPAAFRVKGKKMTGHKQVYQLFIEGREIKATDNHPFLVLTRQTSKGMKGLVRISGFNFSWKQLKDVNRNDLIAYVRQLPDEGQIKKLDFHYEGKGKGQYLKYKINFPRQTNEQLMWFLGVYIGDGYCEKDKRYGRNIPRRVYFAVPPQDRARRKLTQAIKQIFGVNYKPKGICITIPSTSIASFIFHLGFGGIARTKQVPDWVFTLPIKQKLAFLEGILDSDGYVSSSYQIVFTSVNQLLLEQVQLLAISCGLKTYKIRSYKTKRKLALGKEVREYETHQFCLSSHDLKVIRTHRIGIKNTDSFIGFARPSNIKFLGVQPVYDIEIDKAHNFFANGIVVHNSKVTMKYPSFILAGEGARGETLSIAVANAGQHQDVGSKAIHLAPNTKSLIVSKSISLKGGRSSYRGLVQINKGAKGSVSKVICDALILDAKSRTDTYPKNRIWENNAKLEHEATVSKVGEEQLFYLMSRGLSEDQARALVVNGFIEPVVRQLPLEYAVEMNRLIELEMEGSVG